MRNRLRSPIGLSLLDVLIAVVILGVVLSIGVPAFQGVRLSGLLAAGQQDVAASLTRARWMAINSGQQRTVDLTVATTILVKNGSGTTLQSTPLGPYAATQTHTTGVNTFVFDARGMIPAGTATPIDILLTSSRGATKIVRVDRMGRVQMF